MWWCESQSEGYAARTDVLQVLQPRHPQPHMGSAGGSRRVEQSREDVDKQACVESNAIRLRTGSPIGMVWPSHLLLETPKDVEDLDSGAVGISEARMCTWCLEEGHQAFECALLKKVKQSMVDKDEGDVYRCARCHAIDTHPTARCTRPTDYGYSRGSASSEEPRPSPKCHECGEFGHIARFCPAIRCFNCDQLGHQASVCTNPTKCFLCAGEHHQSACPHRTIRDVRDPK